jgi:hypothetical protein
LDQMRKVLVALEKKRKAREETLTTNKKEVSSEDVEKGEIAVKEGKVTTASRIATGSGTKRQRRSI